MPKKPKPFRKPYAPRKGHAKLGITNSAAPPPTVQNPGISDARARPPSPDGRRPGIRDAVKVSPEVQTLAGDLADDYAWPLGSAAQLPEFLQRTATAHRAFMTRVVALLDALDAGKDPNLPSRRKDPNRFLTVRAAADTLATEWGPGFPRRWADFVHRKVRKWEGWTGMLVYLAFGAKGARPDVDRLAAETLAGVGGAGAWELLTETLGGGP